MTITPWSSPFWAHHIKKSTLKKTGDGQEEGEWQENLRCLFPGLLKLGQYKAHCACCL
jgi:hypothetical protein